VQAHRAASLLSNEPVGAIYSSDLHRARSTAAIIAGRFDHPVIADDRLRERCFGIAEGSPLTSMGSAVTGLSEGRIVDTSIHPVGGESLADVYRRCNDFAGWIVSREAGDDVVIVAHGGSIRLLACALTGASLTGMHWRAVPNGSVQRILVERRALDALGDAGVDRTDSASEGAIR
jgi:2,3-bisphosphoglycerate-dependent phosphoglycerate mutase